MKRKKQKNLISEAELLKVSPTQFYKCVGCGFVGNFGIFRQRNLSCQGCGYDLLVNYDKAEYKAAKAQRGTEAVSDV